MTFDRLETPISFTHRFLASCASWTMVVLATPGCLTSEGSALLAAVALVPWGLACSRPGKKAFLAEFLAGFCGMTGLCWWVSYVWIGTLLTVGVMPALWIAVGGVVLRRCARVSPLWLAVPLAWTLGDTLRHAIEPPFSFGWMRHGFNLHDWPVIAGSARVWGVGGLGFALASVSGGLCSWLASGRRKWVPLGIGCVPMLVAALLSALTSAPETRPGPRLLLVQPGIEQVRKQHGEPGGILRSSVEMTLIGLEQAERAGEPDFDMICWGETMLQTPIFEDGLEARLEAGIESPPWSDPPLDPALIRAVRANGDGLVRQFFGQVPGAAPETLDPLIPRGTSFASGAEYYLERDGWVRRANAMFLWDAEGRRGPASMKRHLVPGGESMLGLERYEWVRDTADAVAGYIPDLVASEETVLQHLVARDGQEYWLSATVCFDNLYDDIYVEPLRAGQQVDFHLVGSNEAWFRTSWEMDQMVAFSKLIAIFSGRAMARVTNSGLTCLISADGRELLRLTDAEGEDRGVAGSLAVRVPVPVEGKEASVPFFAYSEPYWIGFWIGAPLLLCLWFRVRRPRIEEPAS